MKAVRVMAGRCFRVMAGLWLGVAASLAPLAAPAADRAPPLPLDVQQLDRYIEDARSEWNNIGAAVAVVQGDTIVYAKGFGVKEHGKADRIDADTLFEVGSTSKAFTAAALGILVDEGKVGWDDPLVRHLPDFKLADPWITRQVTIRDALAHRSGIANTYYSDFGVMGLDETVDQLRYLSPREFRDSFRYDNVMYAAAGKAIAAASGMSWGEFVRHRLLAPLDMRRSGVSPYEFWDEAFVAPTFAGAPRTVPSHTDARDANVALAHLLDETGAVKPWAWQSYDGAAAAGAVVSSARDMAHWVILNLNGGQFQGRNLLKQETVRELHATQNPRSGRPDFPFEPLEGYAMGWFKARYHDTVHLSHGGGMLGFPAYVALLPERGIGVVVLSNGQGGPHRGGGFAFHKSITLWVFDRLLGAPPRNWSHEMYARMREGEARSLQRKAELQQARLRDAPPSLPLEQYVGDYENTATSSTASNPVLNGRVRVSLEQGGLALSFAGEGAFSGRLEHWHHDVFRLRSDIPVDWGQFPRFSLTETGKIVSMTFFGQTFLRLEPQVGL